MISGRQAQKQRLIRVLVACKDNGFDTERKQLAANLYPKLRHYCMATHGVEFQLLDFGGGSPGRHEEDRKQYNEQLFLCHEQSLGPGLIAFVDGDVADYSSPRDSGFHQILDQAYFNYPNSKRNQKCLFIVRRSADPDKIHDRTPTYVKQKPKPEPETLVERITNSTNSQNRIGLVLHTSKNEKINVEQDHYLEGFCDLVYQQMVKLIDENMNEFTNSNPEASLKPEMTQHWDFAQMLSSYSARENVQEKIKSYLEGESEQIYVVHGPYAQDLSAIMARVAWAVRDWTVNHGHHQVTSVVLRHIGLTPGSDYKIQLLRSIRHQLKGSSQEPLTAEQIEQQFHQIVHDGEHQGNLVIFLDAIHLLDDLTWIPKRLAGNVKMVVSLTTDSVAMATIKRKCYDYEQYVPVPMLTLAEQVESLAVLHKSRYQQRLSKENLSQFADVLKNCDKSGYYTSTLVRFAENQRLPLITSFQTLRSTDICLENQVTCVSMNHSPTLLQKALGYLAVSPDGLSQLELEDILSLDNEVMKETEATCTNRFPSQRICALMKDLQPLLIHLQFHGIEVYKFKDPVVQMYMYKEYVENQNSAKSLHSHLADYFLGAWHKRPKAFCDEKYSNRKVQTPEQILVYNSETKFPVYNKRKLMLMPYHLAKSDRTAELKSLVLYNFQWILTKFRAFGIPDLVQDYSLYEFAEAGVIATALKESEAIVIHDDSVLSIQLSGRLLAYYNEYTVIKHLVDQCDDYSCRNGGLIPRLPLFVAPDTVLEKCGQIPNGPKYEHSYFKNANVQLLSVRKPIGHVVIYDQDLNEKICEVTVPDVHKTFITPDGKYMISFTKVSQILMHSTETGDLVMELPYAGDLVYQTAITEQYLSFTMQKSAGPHILDLTQGTFIHRLNLQCKIVSMSRCSQYLVCDGSRRLNIYTLPLCQRLCTLDIKDVRSIVFAPKQGPQPKGPDFYAVTKTGDMYHVTIEMVCNTPTKKKIIRDVEMRGMAYAPNDKKYLVDCTRTIHVFDTDDRQLFAVKSLIPVDGNLIFEQALFTDDSEILVTIQGIHVSVWSNEGKLLRVLVNSSQQNFTNAMTKGHDLFTLDSDYTASKWDLCRVKNGTKPEANIHSGSVDRIVMINENTVACYGDESPEVTIFNMDTGRKLRTLVPRNDSGCVIVHVSGSKNGEFLLTVQATAEPIFPTQEVVCDAALWKVGTSDCLLRIDGTEYAGFSPQSDLAYFIRYTPGVGRDVLVYNTSLAGQKTIPLPPLTILARPIVDSGANLRLFTADMEGVDLLLWKIPLNNSAENYKSVYFTETYLINDIRSTNNDDVVHILYTGGLITYDLALHQIMRKIPFPSTPQTIYNSQYTMALDGRRLHDLNNARNERLLRMRAAPNLVTFVLKDNYLAYISEEYDRLVIKGVKDGRRRAWCPLHGRGTSITIAKDDRTILVGCEDGRIMALTLVLDSQDSANLISQIPSRHGGRPRTSKQVLDEDIHRVVMNSATNRVMSASRPASRLRPSSSLPRPRPFTPQRCRPTSSPAIRLVDRPYTR